MFGHVKTIFKITRELIVFFRNLRLIFCVCFEFRILWRGCFKLCDVACIKFIAVSFQKVNDIILTTDNLFPSLSQKTSSVFRVIKTFTKY